jgi:hypothetical protein
MKSITLMLSLMAVLLIVSCTPSLKVDQVSAVCTINDSSEIIENSHKILHDFDTVVDGCDANFGPSGIVYHPGLDRLIIVSDKGGQYATIKNDGTELACKDLKDVHGDKLNPRDHEGVTYANPNDGFIYVALEDGGKAGVAFIRQVELSSSRVTKTWKVKFPEGVEGSDGLEGITFVRDKSHTEGGTFYLGDQTADKVVGKCDVPIISGGSTDTEYECAVEILPGFKEASGLDYSADANIKDQRGVVFVSADRDNSIAAYSPDGEYLDWTRELPESAAPGEEGHAIFGCNLYISADANNESRKIHSYRLSIP